MDKRKKLIVAAVVGVVVVASAAFLVGPPPNDRATTSAAQVAASGATTLEAADPVHDRTVTMSHWKPEGEGNSQLVVISHGFAGDRTSHDFLAVELTKEGYTVIAPTHPDVAGLESSDRRLDPLALRPRHLSLAIDAAEQERTQLGSFDNVSVVGHSLGGYAGLRLVGAAPSVSELETYCLGSPEDPLLCTDRLQERVSALPNVVRDIDERVDRLVLLAPAYGPLFEAIDLGAVQVPVLLVAASDDIEVPKRQTDVLTSGLPPISDTYVLNGAGHFDFVRTCVGNEFESMANLCGTSEGAGREAFHSELLAETLRFLAEE